MKQSASRLRKVPETAEELAEMPARALPDQAVASRAIPIDLRPVISAYRKRGRFQLRIEKLPQGARFSAGQNNGDGSWSLLLDELEDLVYFAPKTVSGDHTLALRLISKDETEAFTIALIDYTVRIADAPAQGGAGPALSDAIRDEVHRLKAALEARETELTQLRESAERMGVMLQQKLDSAVAEARAQWRREEAARLDAEKARLEEQFAHRMAEQELRSKALTDIAREQQEAAIRLARQEFTAARDSLAARDGELAAARAQMERLRQDWEAEIQSARAAGEAKIASSLATAKAEWQALSEARAAEIAAQHDSEVAQMRIQADARLAGALKEAESAAAKALAAAEAEWAARQDATAPDLRAEAELDRLRAELARMREDAAAGLAAAQAAADARTTAALQAAEAEWRARLERALADLAAARESAPEIELARVRGELDRARADASASLAAAQAAADARTTASLQAAEAEWKARLEKALADLAMAREAAPQGDLRGEDERKRLRAEVAKLRETARADLAAADAQAAEALKNAEGEWLARSERALAALRGRCEAAEAALVAADGPAADREAEIRHLQTQLDHLQKTSEAEIAAIRLAAETRQEEIRKTLQAETDTRIEVAMAEARREGSATALAAAGTQNAGILAERDAEIQQLRAQIEHQAKAAEADMAAAKAAAETAAGEKLKAAQATWERETANAIAGASARTEKAEAALAVEQRASAERVRDDEYVHSLEREIKTLRATLVDREAAIVNAQAMQEHQRLGTVREGPGARWQPLSNRPAEVEQRPKISPASLKLLRDIGVVGAFAAAAVLLLPKLEASLPNSVRWQIETLGGFYLPETTAPAEPPPVAAATQTRAEPPRLYATRALNVRGAPSTGAAVVASLKRSTPVAVLETKDNWSLVQLSGGQQGWVFKTYLTVSDPGSATPAAAPAAAKTNVPAPVSRNAAPIEPVASSGSVPPVAAEPSP